MGHKGKRKSYDDVGCLRTDQTEDPSVPRFLGYGLPRAPKETESGVFALDDFELHDVLFGASESFLDFDGVVLFGGAFETKRTDYRTRPFAVCADKTDLDIREREFYTAIQKGKTVIFLVPDLPQVLNIHKVDFRVDLFRRVMNGFGIQWDVLHSPVAHVHSEIAEFQEFINRFGTAYIRYYLPDRPSNLARPICGSKDRIYALSIRNKVFMLPCAYPRTHDLAVEMAIRAIRAVRDYRERIKEAFPEWVAEYRFGKESELVEKAEEMRVQLLTIELKIDVYKQYKGVLCFRSDPLVRVVTEILNDFFGIKLEVDDKCVEDAALKDEQGKTLAVFEIKGVNGNFGRENVNQVDSHRERLDLSPETPGVLIMNTIMSTDSFEKKNQPPHPDIIKKAADDNVLLVRTLDLLRYADCIEKGVLRKEDFRVTIVGESGWLRVEDDTAGVVKE